MRKYGVVCLVTGTLALPVSSGLRAQSTNAFEVASVKPNASGAPGIDIDTQPGRVTITNATLRNLITFGYRIQDSQLVGGPEWALLSERFRLVMHNESRELPIYALVAPRADGRTGQLKASDVDCSGLAGSGSRGCAFSVRFGNISARGMPVARLAAVLSQFAGRIVVDRTGISGPHDFDLTWTPDQFCGRQTAPGEPPPQVNGSIVDANGPSLFTAIQEQLGLKLESTRAPVDVLLIDGAERPERE